MSSCVDSNVWNAASKVMNKVTPDVRALSADVKVGDNSRNCVAPGSSEPQVDGGQVDSVKGCPLTAAANG